MGRELRLSSYQALAVASDVLLPQQEFDGPSCLIHTNFDRVNPAMAERHLRDLYVAGRHTIAAVQLCRLARETQVVVIGTDDALPVLGRDVLRDQWPPYFAAANIDAIVPLNRAATPIAGETILIARYGIRTWGHWLGELLPKIVVAEENFPGRFRYALPEFVRHNPALRSTRQSLAYYGIEPPRIVWLSQDLTYEFDNLYCVSSIWTGGKVHPAALALMREGRRRHGALSTSSKIALLRTESHTRSLANVGEIVPLVEDAGFVRVEVGRLPFAEQVQVLTNAAQVVGVLGSGLAGLMYAPSDVEIMTLAPGDWHDSFFFAMMQERNARLIDLRGKRVSSETRPLKDPPFRVDVADVGKGLAALSPGSASPAAPPGETASAAPAPVGVSIMAHIQDLGDRVFEPEAWVGSEKSDKYIEGFTIYPWAGVDPSDFRYCAVFGDGLLSDWCEGGIFCGSRGRHFPLYGFCLELRGAAAAEYECGCVGVFADGVTLGPVRQSEVCRSPGLAPMMAYKVTLRPRPMKLRRTGDRGSLRDAG